MPFDFQTVYMLTHDGPLGTTQQIVLGARGIFATAPDGKWSRCWQFLTTGDSGREFFGEVVRDEGEVLELRDSVQTQEVGSPVIWRFEPLTLALWEPTVDPDVRDRVRELRVIATDAALQEYYRQHFLHDWWKEHPQ